MTKDEAMKLALDALEYANTGNRRPEVIGPAITALREALAEQPAQRCPLCNYQHGHAIGCENNPVDIALNKMAENARELGLDYEPENTLHWHALNYRTASTQNAQVMFERLEKFVAPQRIWVGLDDADLVVCEKGGKPQARYWEKVLREKNSQPVLRPCRSPYCECSVGQCSHPGCYDARGEPLPPAQRTWVGLTDEEVTKMPAWIYSPDQDGMTAEEGLEAFARAVEAKLKEKNTP